MAYPQPGIRDYLKLLWHMIGWRFWKPKRDRVIIRSPQQRSRPCIGCKFIGNLPRGRCDVCGPPAWEAYEWDYTEPES